MRHLRNRNIWLGLACVVLLLVVFRSPTDNDLAPLSTASARDDGTKAMSMLLSKYGTKTVETPLPVPAGRALMLRDQLGREQTEAIRQWVNDGGTLILAEPYSDLSPFQIYSGRVRPVEGPLRPECSSPLAEGVRRIAPTDGGTFSTPLTSLEADPEGEACFLVDGGYHVAARTIGAGRVIVLSSPVIFTNARLDKEDNAVLVMNLLSSTSGELAIIRPQTIDEGGQTSGEQSIGDLLPDNFVGAMKQLVIAAFLMMLWRGRRFGRPLEEPLPVEIPASALTVAMANLLQTAGRSNAAAHILRRNLRRDLSTMLGLRPDTEAHVLAEVAAERTGIDRRRLEYLLADGPYLDSAQLLQLAQQLEMLHQEVANVR